MSDDEETLPSREEMMRDIRERWKAETDPKQRRLNELFDSVVRRHFPECDTEDDQ